MNPEGKEKERSKATSTAELQQTEVYIQPHMQARLKRAEVYIQSHRQAKGLNEQKSTDSLKYRLRTRRKAAIQTAEIQSMIQAKATRVALN